jgi:predicted bacteriocin transport accessory protein
VKKKSKYLALLLCFILVSIIALSKKYWYNNEEVNFDVNLTNTLTSISYHKLNTIKKSEIIVYIGRSDCQDCRAFNEFIKKLNKGDNKIKMYYLDIRKARNDALNKNASAKEIQYYKNLQEDLNIKWVPTVLKMKDGRILSKYEYLDEKYYSLKTKKERKTYVEAEQSEFKDWFRRNNVNS